MAGDQEPIILSRGSLVKSEYGGHSDGLGFEVFREAESPQQTMDTDHQTYLNSNEYLKDTGRWFLNSPQFQSWADGHIIPFLWVRGLPGSGKPVLAASVIAALQGYDSNACAFFFCIDSKPSTQSASFIIRSIINQLANKIRILRTILITCARKTRSRLQ